MSRLTPLDPAQWTARSHLAARPRCRQASAHGRRPRTAPDLRCRYDGDTAVPEEEPAERAGLGGVTRVFEVAIAIDEEEEHVPITSASASFAALDYPGGPIPALVIVALQFHSLVVVESTH